MCWELLAGTHGTTHLCCHGGGIAGQPADKKFGLDLWDLVNAQAFYSIIALYRPWLLVIGFPSHPWSTLTVLTIDASCAAGI